MYVFIYLRDIQRKRERQREREGETQADSVLSRT